MPAKGPRNPQPKQPKLVESTNSLDGLSFYNKHLSAKAKHDFHQHLNKNASATRQPQLELKTSADLKKDPVLLNECLDLIEHTSKPDYDASETKWSRSKKRKEMLLVDIKYLVSVYRGTGVGGARGGEGHGGGDVSDPEPKLSGFISFMITYEDGHEVLYIYEIHFIPESQGRGYGGAMMELVESIGRNVGVEKVMLTVFRANERAVKWYERRGYKLDEFSPEPRVFRDGSVKEATYSILSKNLTG